MKKVYMALAVFLVAVLANSTIMDELVLCGSDSYDAKEIDDGLHKVGFVK